jgi:hypothetical protein
MATIAINSITCVKLQDAVGPDEVEAQVDGKKVAGPVGIRKGETVTLNTAPRHFTGTVDVKLLELDGNFNKDGGPDYSKADDLGSHPVSEEPVTDVEMHFGGPGSPAKHAFYTLNYTVTSDDAGTPAS